jgi:spore coat protein H
VEDAENRPSGITGLQQFREGLRYLQAFVTRRAAFLRQELERHRARPLGLALSAFSPREGWVELRNYGEEPVSTRGLVLTKNLRRALERNVPARTVPPGGTVRFTAEELGLTNTPPPRADGAPGFPPKGELGLFTGDSVVGVLDVLFYGELPPGLRYARRQEEPTRWEVR